MKVLVTIPVNETHKKELASKAGAAKLVYVLSNNVTAKDVADVEAIIGNVPADLLKDAKKLRWLQLNSAGADAYIKDGVMPEGATLTNATGAYGLALSEHMLAQLLAMMKKLYPYYDNQKEGLWKDEGTVHSIYGSTVLVVGLGDIGGSFARRMKALGAYVIGMRRRSNVIPDYADEMASLDDLDQVLGRADIIASSLPGTAATKHLFNKKRFAAMKKGAYFLNIGRGTAVVSADLCAAVKTGQLAGAAVDVTDPEPLPADDPMWKVPGLYITPHISGQYHLAATLDNIVHIAAQNLAAFLKEQPLRNEVDFTTGYKK
jgi:phosphoglycerate dehydrogenase-like enzyme